MIKIVNNGNKLIINCKKTSLQISQRIPSEPSRSKTANVLSDCLKVLYIVIIISKALSSDCVVLLNVFTVFSLFATFVRE